MEEQYTQEKMLDMLRGIRLDNFLIECLKVIDRDLICERGVTDPARASEIVASVFQVIEELRKQDFCNEDVDHCIQQNIQYIFKQTGIIKE